MYKGALYFLLFNLSLTSFSQEHASPETQTLMRREFVAGVHFNTRGWGFSASYGFQKNYKYKSSIGMLFTNIRHEKEQKIYPDIITSTKGYYYGKLNSLVSLRLTYGGKLLLFPSKRENGIEISAKWDAGVSLGLLKPVYLKIDHLNSLTLDERYDPTLHNSANISSRSSWFKGLGEASFLPGIHGRVALDFNFSPVREMISGGEIGMMIDYFFVNEVNIMYKNPSPGYFTSLYLQFNFGQRLY